MVLRYSWPSSITWLSEEEAKTSISSGPLEVWPRLAGAYTEKTIAASDEVIASFKVSVKKPPYS